MSYDPQRTARALFALLLLAMLSCSDAGERAGSVRIFVSAESPDLSPDDDGKYPLLRSDDRGRTWIAITPPGTHRVSGISFASRDVGWVVADTDRIYFTADGGETWQAQGEEIGTFFIEPVLSGVATVDGRSVIAVGLDGLGAGPGGTLNFPPAIVRSTDGGATWSPATIVSGADSVSPLGNLCLLDSGVGMAVSNAYSGQNRFTTADGGVSWRLQPPLATNGAAFTCAGDADLWLIGTYFSFRSRDGGATWQDVSNQIPIARPVPNGNVDVAVGAVVFADPDHGWIFGFEVVARDPETNEPTATRQFVLETQDRGDSWQRIELPDTRVGATSVSRHDVLAVGKSKGLLHVDGAWQAFDLPANTPLTYPAAVALVE